MNNDGSSPLFSILRAAESMEVPPRKAISVRLRYLMPRLAKLRQEAAVTRKRVARAFTQRVRTRLEVTMYIVQEELDPLEREAQVLLDFINGKINLELKASSMSPEMIAQAKAVPIEQVLGVKCRGGLVHCPFHEDMDPSASIKNNFLICFGGCMPKDGRKGWDTISLLMERDGLSFRGAVLALIR